MKSFVILSKYVRAPDYINYIYIYIEKKVKINFWKATTI